MDHSGDAVKAKQVYERRTTLWILRAHITVPQTVTPSEMSDTCEFANRGKRSDERHPARFMFRQFIAHIGALFGGILFGSWSEKLGRAKHLGQRFKSFGQIWITDEKGNTGASRITVCCS
jgi:hypothetical protein